LEHQPLDEAIPDASESTPNLTTTTTVPIEEETKVEETPLEERPTEETVDDSI